MKRIMVLLILALVTFSSGAEAQTPTKPNVFWTKPACEEARQTGPEHYRYYEAVDTETNKAKNPINNKDRIIFHLPSDLCLKAATAVGPKFVVQKEGTPFRAYVLPDGSRKLYAMDSCGNAVLEEIIFPAPARSALLEPESEPEPEMVPAVVPRAVRPRPIVQVVPVKPKKASGFCKSKKCRWTFVVIGAAVAGGAAYYYWPCPPGTGTVRR